MPLHLPLDLSTSKHAAWDHACCETRNGAKLWATISKDNEITLQRVLDNDIACGRLDADSCGVEQNIRRGVRWGPTRRIFQTLPWANSEKN